MVALPSILQKRRIEGTSKEIDIGTLLLTTEIVLHVLLAVQLSAYYYYFLKKSAHFSFLFITIT